MFALGTNALTAVQIAQTLAIEQGALQTAQQEALLTGALVASGSPFVNTAGSSDTFSGPTLHGLPHIDDGFSISDPDTAGRPLVEFSGHGLTAHPLTTVPKFSFSKPETKPISVTTRPTTIVASVAATAFSTFSLLEQLALLGQTHPIIPPTPVLRRSAERAIIGRAWPFTPMAHFGGRTFVAQQASSPVTQLPGLEADTTPVAVTSPSLYELALAVLTEERIPVAAATLAIVSEDVQQGDPTEPQTPPTSPAFLTNGPTAQAGVQQAIRLERAPDDREYVNWIGYGPRWKKEDAVGDTPTLPRQRPANGPAQAPEKGDRPVEPGAGQKAITTDVLYPPLNDQSWDPRDVERWPLRPIWTPMVGDTSPPRPTPPQKPTTGGGPTPAFPVLTNLILDLRAVRPDQERFGLDSTVEFPTTRLRVAATSASNGDGGRDGGDDAQQQPRQ